MYQKMAIEMMRACVRVCGDKLVKNIDCFTTVYNCGVYYMLEWYQFLCFCIVCDDSGI